MTVLLFDSDLIFSSKVKATVKRIGLECEVVGQLEDCFSNARKCADDNS